MERIRLDEVVLRSHDLANTVSRYRSGALAESQRSSATRHLTFDKVRTVQYCPVYCVPFCSMVHVLEGMYLDEVSKTESQSGAGMDNRM